MSAGSQKKAEQSLRFHPLHACSDIFKNAAGCAVAMQTNDNPGTDILHRTVHDPTFMV